MKEKISMQALLTAYNQPLLELVFQAAQVHRVHHNATEIQLATLLSIKTGGCTEDCAYCGQAARYHTGIEVKSLLPLAEVLLNAQRAKDNGASRFCMAAAWREVRDNRDFDRILEMVKAVNAIGMEVCCTLGMLSEAQALRLKEAGLYAYNHNLDTSAEYYKNIISTRTQDDRLTTLQHVRQAGLTVCSGGIIGLGESIEDRIAMLYTLANLPITPESVPINTLVRIPGTPLSNNEKLNCWEIVRMVAIARIAMPKTMVRLSAGRLEMTEVEQAWCFMAGANSIFVGENEKLLVTPNPQLREDQQMLKNLGLKPMVKST